MSAPALKWLVATSLPCADRLAVAEVRLFIATHASPRALHVIANIFDGKPSRCRETLQLAAGNAWCGLASIHLPHMPSCVVLAHQSVIHTNTHTIHKYDKEEYKHYMTREGMLLFYLFQHFESAMMASFRVSDPMANDTKSWKLDWKNPRVMREFHRRSPRGSNATYCWGVGDAHASHPHIPK